MDCFDAQEMYRKFLERRGIKPPPRHLDPVDGVEQEEERLRAEELKELYKETDDEDKNAG